MNIDLDKIGNFLFEQRNKKGLTQEQLASMIGASFKTVSKWENGGSFPDVAYQLLLCNALDITLKELQMGCLDEEERHKNKCLRIFTRFSLIFIAITIPILCFLLIYFSSHVGKPKIYRINSTTSSNNVGKATGLLIKSYKQNYLMINALELYNYEFDESDIISMDLYSDDHVVFHNNEISSFLIKFDNEYEVNYQNLYFIITIKNGINSEVFKIDLEKKSYLNIASAVNHNKYSYDDIDYYLQSSLKNSGFKNIVGDIWTKSINDSSYNININVYVDSNRFYYSKTTNDMVAELYYYHDYDLLEATIYSNQILNTIIEKYNYNYSNDELDCKVGLCASYKKAIADIEEYVSLLNGE